MKIKINEIIVVEGKYDKIKLSNIVDTVILTTDGFGLFKDNEKKLLLKKFALEKGLLIITDSDSAGFLIRNYIKKFIPKSKIYNAYIPQIEGKEKRKDTASKEGLLGVEGIMDNAIIESIKKSGVKILDSTDELSNKSSFTKADFYDLGLIGRDCSKALREKLCKKLDLPPYLSSNALLDAINIFYDSDYIKSVIQEIL